VITLNSSSAISSEAHLADPSVPIPGILPAAGYSMSTLNAEAARELVVDALEEIKAVNIAQLDVRELSDVMDCLVICSGTSNRHVKSLADNVVVKCKQAGLQPLGVEGQDAGEWVLVDLGDVVVHIMLPATRDFYDLERLWMNPHPA